MNRVKKFGIQMAAVVMVMIPYVFGRYYDTDYRYVLMILHAIDTAIIYLLLRKMAFDD